MRCVEPHAQGYLGDDVSAKKPESRGSGGERSVSRSASGLQHGILPETGGCVRLTGISSGTCRG